ncbi:hypothetical protein CDAR_3841 [Caerostris darwini]|uniref:Uncharacterized protein n=1 Tax=Caerostris darwini TaxID=1538125 RepID=A0AAV4RMQ0_9ARAC|nr:hypothetical protein CDAR_3841 [Caerostris darwini]
MVFLRSQLISSSSILEYLVVKGHSYIEFFIHIGPSHHLVFSRWVAFQPLLGKPVGFSSPRIHPQDEGRPYLRIASTRFSTKTNQLSSLVIHVRTGVE